MKTLFSNKHAILLIRGGITLMILAIMVTIFTASPLGTLPSYAYKAATRPQLGTTKTAFSDFCYASFMSGLRSQGLNCLRNSKKGMQFLQQMMSADSFAKWPQQASLSTLAQQNLLFDPQTKASIKTQQDFLAALQSADPNLQFLFRGPQGDQLVSSLWNYLLTSSDAPPPPAPPVKASDQPPGCPGSSQTFQSSDLWPVVGPMLLTSVSQSMQDRNGQNLGVYDAYGRLLLQNHCSVAALGLTMKALNGNTQITAATVSQWERDALATVANSSSLANNSSVKGLFSVLGQPDNTLIDSWFSAAIMTHPITALTASTAPSTSGSATPTASPTSGSATPTASPNSDATPTAEPVSTSAPPGRVEVN